MQTLRGNRQQAAGLLRRKAQTSKVEAGTQQKRQSLTEGEATLREQEREENPNSGSLH